MTNKTMQKALKSCKYSILFILIIFYLRSFSQNVFVVEAPGNKNNYKFLSGNKIRLKLNDSKRPFTAEIKSIDDSVLTFNKKYSPVKINKIQIVYKENKGVSILSKILIPMGLIFAPIDIINNAINNDKPIVRETPLIISVVCLSAGLLISLDTYKKCKIGKDSWKIKVLSIKQ